MPDRSKKDESLEEITKKWLFGKPIEKTTVFKPNKKAHNARYRALREWLCVCTGKR